MVDGDGLLVVGQPVRRRPTEGPHRPVEARDHRRQRPVPRRDHHPEPAPRQPRAEQVRCRPPMARAVTPVPLGPHARLDDPRPIHPPPARAGSSPSPGPPPAARCGPSRRSPSATSLSNTTSARILPWDRSTHSSILAKNPSINFGRSTGLARHRPATRHRASRPSPRPCDASTPPARRRRGTTARQIECFQNLHDFLVRLHVAPPGRLVVFSDRPVEPGGAPTRRTPAGNEHQRGQNHWPPAGRTVGHHRAATWPPPGRISWPPTCLARSGPPRAIRVIGPRDTRADYPKDLQKVPTA